MDTEIKRPRFRRKQYIVLAKFQLKYAGLILLLMFLTAATCAYVVYYTTMILMGEKLANVYPQGQLVTIVKMVNLRLLAGIVLVSPLVLILGIYLSHKIAGPMYRMEKYLNGMAAGDFTSRIVLRKGDEFAGLAESMNKANDAIKSFLVTQRTRLTQILKETAVLRNKLPDTSAADRLEREILELLKEIDKCKV